ncbi:universal stress protein [Polaromonas sp.]|uniref:universal stress protein n=1 Tax=Polaromonas sp. TaxID=1869339 RepID=UPI00248A8B0A|nr:universal stress protein [Polaromonas sp.]MDI1272838.1 universal stress protein [Polaromonas sp.]
MKTFLTQLLVHLDASPQAPQRLEAGCRIGQAYGAAVTGLYAVTPSFVALPFAPEVGPGVAAALREMDDELRSRARAAFDRVQTMPGMQAAWAEAGDDPVMGVFAEQALYADLLVLGQHDPASTPATGVPVDFAESVMVASGKPALILPYIGAPSSIGDTVVLAWKPTREAARAVSAALPMLQRARRVHVLSWSDTDEAVSGQRLDLDSYLKLHGVDATWHRETGEPELLGELLLSRAFDLGADLLVMGCYGHSRAREWVLGGTSRTVLRSMTLPVLMAH